MIMLIGLVTKNGILIVEFANKRREHGLSKIEAVLEAAEQRLRPILMTSLATSLGALPIALSLGASSASRVPLGIVVVGGILFSLILTLFVIPCMYIFLASKHNASTSQAGAQQGIPKEDIPTTDGALALPLSHQKELPPRHDAETELGDDGQPKNTDI
jgi:predicted RND superfamily exporter protein